jgi:single-strand DNA-binding protein
MGAQVAERTLPSGDIVTTFTIVVDRPRVKGERVRVDAIACQVFRAATARKVAAIEPGEWVQAEGTLRRRFWRAPAGLGSAMEVEVSRIQRAA